jgi:hypothetical protein
VTGLLVASACLVTAVGTLAALSALSRLRFGRLPGAFRCRLGPSWRGRRRRVAWQIRRTRAVWLHDVLLVQSGLLRLSVTPVSPEIARDVSVEALEPFEVRGLGTHAVALRLTAGNGRPLVVATSGRDRTALVGPFLAASVPGLPRAPREHGV